MFHEIISRKHIGIFSLACLSLVFLPFAAEGHMLGRGSHYEYTDTGGANTGEVMKYKLDLGYPFLSTCNLRMEGYQSDQTILCEAIDKNDRIDVQFKSYGDGNLLNQFGGKVYAPGDVLFSLSFTDSKDGRSEKIVTTWRKMESLFDKPKTGAYFSPVFVKP